MSTIPIKKPATIDEYIGAFPSEVQKILEEIRITIQKAAPDAKEKISYSMPAFDQNGIVVYFQLFKNISDYMLCQAVMKLFRRNYQSINREKVLFNFH